MGLQETEMRTMPVTLDITKERVFCRENVVAECGKLWTQMSCLKGKVIEEIRK